MWLRGGGKTKKTTTSLLDVLQNITPKGRGRSERERGLGEGGLRGHLRLRSRRFAAMAKDLGRADFFLLESSSFARNEDVLVGGEAPFTNACSPVPSLADHAPLSLPLSLSCVSRASLPKPRNNRKLLDEVVRDASPR